MIPTRHVLRRVEMGIVTILVGGSLLGLLDGFVGLFR